MRIAGFVLAGFLVTGSEVSARPDLDAVRVVARGGLRAPRFSPDGTMLLVSGEQFVGLSLVPIGGGPRKLLTQEAGAGWGARFIADGRVVFVRRVMDRRVAAVIDIAATITEYVTDPPEVITRGDRIWIRTTQGLLHPIQTNEGDRFFAPVVSPDGARVAFLGLTTGVWIYERATSRLTSLGAGTAPTWSPDGTRLAFERTEDDGERITGSELYLWETGSGVSQLTSGPRIERRPSFSPDGRTLAFDDDRGAILTAVIR